MNLAICRLRESTQNEWISIADMKAWIRSELFIEQAPLKWVKVDDDRVRIALETPILLGLVEGAYRGKKLEGIKLTPVGESVLAKNPEAEVHGSETFFVLPNFELTVFTSEMNYHTLYQLMMLAEPVKTDVVSTFRITDQSIFQAIEVGLRENDILEFLERESSKPVPKNVVRSITDWTSQTTFAKVSEIKLLETESERDLEDLLLLDDFNQYVVRRVGPSAVIVTGDMEKLVEEMALHKCNVKMAGKEALSAEVSSGTAFTEQVLLFGDQSVTDVPEACIGCPAIPSCNRVVKRKVTKRK